MNIQFEIFEILRDIGDSEVRIKDRLKEGLYGVTTGLEFKKFENIENERKRRVQRNRKFRILNFRIIRRECDERGILI